MSPEIVRRRVLEYLLDHPAARDTGEGIRLWWLGDTGEAGDVMVREALEGLVSRGWLQTRGEKPDARVYALNPDEAPAIREYLNTQPDRPTGRQPNG